MRNSPANARPLHQAETEAGVDPVADTPEKRKQVSTRDFINAAGATVDKIEEASGARYTLKANNKAVEFQFGDPGKFATMCAIFGFHTKVGNVANTVLNDKADPGDADDAYAAASDWLEQGQAGTWAERAAGGVGAKIDKDALAAAIVEVAAAGGKQLDPVVIREKLEDDPQFVKTARQVPAIRQNYEARTGKTEKTVDDLLGALA